MFERFTQPARQVIVLAQDEARILKHNYIGTEHILLGVLRESEGVGAHVLRSLDVTVDGARARVIEMVGHGDQVAPSRFPFTPRAKKVLDLGMQEADRLDDRQVATHHLLLGLLREGEGVANRVLDAAGEPDHVRGLVLAGLDGATEEPPAPTETLTRISRGTDPTASPKPAAGSAAEICSFCGERGAHMFAGFPPQADEVSICNLCLDVFHASLAQQGEQPRPDGPATDAD